MSLLKYNSVALAYPLTTSFMQDSVYDDQGQTDRCYIKFDISTQALLNYNYLNLYAPDLVGKTTSPAAAMKVIRERLLQQRKAISFTFNGVELIPAAQTGNTGTVDARNGPQPQSCNVTEMTNTSFLFTYRVVAHYWENNSDPDANGNVTNKKGADVVYNRWTETVDMDDCMMTKRSRRGKYVIRSDNASGIIADQARTQMAVVGVPDGFLRESSQYTVSADGLAIEYSVTDHEVFKKPPSPAFKATGYYKESTTSMGAMRLGECHVSLKGAKTTPQDKLLDAAIKVATKKIANRINQLNKANFANGYIVKGGDAKIDLYENTAECTFTVMIKAVPGRNSSVAAFKGMNTTTPLSDGVSYTPPYLDRGTAKLLLQAAKYYDPSLAGVVLGAGPTTLVSNPVKEEAGSVQLTAGLQVGQEGKQKGV